MKRSEGIAIAALLTACSRTVLDVPSGASAARPLRIAFFGEVGVRDESEISQFLSTYGTVVRTQTEATPLTSEVLADFDVVILDRLVRDYSPDEAATFASWIASGGAVVSLTGYVNLSSDWSRPNSLLSPLDAVYEAGLVLGSSPQTITQFDPHPLTTGLSAVVFWGGYDISIGAEWTAVAYADNAVVGAAREYGSGRVFMWGDEWVEYSSSFSSPDTTRFWKNAIDWLRPH